MEWRKIQRMMNPDVEFEKKSRFNDKQLAVKELVEALKDKIRSDHHPLINETKQLQTLNRLVLENVDNQPGEYIERLPQMGEKWER